MAKDINFKLIWRFNNGDIIFFKQGAKDAYQVNLAYGVKEGETIFNGYPPRDVDYLNDIRNYAHRFGNKSIEDDIIYVYIRANDTLSNQTCKEIVSYIAGKYYNFDGVTRDYLRQIVSTYLTLYATMIAEYHYICKNGKHSVFKKSVKLLALMQTIRFPHVSIQDIADFSKGITFTEFTKACINVGFDWKDSLRWKPNNIQ